MGRRTCNWICVRGKEISIGRDGGCWARPRARESVLRSNEICWDATWLGRAFLLTEKRTTMSATKTTVNDSDRFKFRCFLRDDHWVRKSMMLRRQEGHCPTCSSRSSNRDTSLECSAIEARNSCPGCGELGAEMFFSSVLSLKFAYKIGQRNRGYGRRFCAR